MTRVMTVKQIEELTCDEPVNGVYSPDWNAVQQAIDGKQGTLSSLLAKRIKRTVADAEATGEMKLDLMMLVRIVLFQRRNLETAEMLITEKRLLEKYTAIADGDQELDGITNQGATKSKQTAAAGAQESIWSKKDPWGP
jgi:hypothetical protein